MLDVLHVLLEDDMIPVWEHGIETKDAVRGSMYSNMYKKEYKYSSSKSASTNSQWEGAAGPSFYDAPPDGSIKPYIPPTDEQDLHALLGGPMGE